MCAIFGSFNKSMFEVLHDVNQIRGAWGGSYMGIYDVLNYSPNKKKNIKKLYQIKRWEGKQDKISKILEPDKFDIYLGHLQAPTGSNRKWSEETTHPFHIGEWIISHNGVITNQESLIKEYNNGIKVSVDSKLIPIMANSISSTKTKVNHIIAIEKALAKLEGTFSVWVYNTDSKKVYIARQGSTLFADDRGNFSSINSKNQWEELKEGKIFELTSKGPVLVGQFKNKSPFFI